MEAEGEARVGGPQPVAMEGEVGGVSATRPRTREAAPAELGAGEFPPIFSCVRSSGTVACDVGSARVGALKGRGTGGWSESYFPLSSYQSKKLRGALQGLGALLVGGSSRSFHTPYCYANCPWKILGFEVEVCPGGGAGAEGAVGRALPCFVLRFEGGMG